MISEWYVTSVGSVFVLPESSQTFSPTWEPKIKGPSLSRRSILGEGGKDSVKKSPSTSSFAGSLSSTWSTSLPHVSSSLSWPSSFSTCHQMQVSGQGAPALLLASSSSPTIQARFSCQLKPTRIVLQLSQPGFPFNQSLGSGSRFSLQPQALPPLCSPLLDTQ